jgi:hypothetical protein
MTILSNADALLVAVPMIILLVVGHFRLDELFGKPRKVAPRRRELASVQEDGAVNLDPDGTATGAHRRHKLPSERRRPRVEAECE